MTNYFRMSTRKEVEEVPVNTSAEGLTDQILSLLAKGEGMPLISDEKRREILDRWNNIDMAAMAYGTDRPSHDEFLDDILSAQASADTIVSKAREEKARRGEREKLIKDNIDTATVRHKTYDNKYIRLVTFPISEEEYQALTPEGVGGKR